MTTTLLSLALSLLIAAQQPNVDPALKDRAIALANQAIAIAVQATGPTSTILEEENPKIRIFGELIRSLNPYAMSVEEYEDAAQHALELADDIWWRDDTREIEDLRRLVQEKFHDFESYAGNFKGRYTNATDNQRIRTILAEIKTKVGNELKEEQVEGAPGGAYGCLVSDPSVPVYRKADELIYVTDPFNFNPPRGTLYSVRQLKGEAPGLYTRAEIVKDDQVKTKGCAFGSSSFFLLRSLGRESVDAPTGSW